jgi:peptidoglycan/xylan/chitin deacetylase (PgdA/CDA1 family)
MLGDMSVRASLKELTYGLSHRAGLAALGRRFARNGLTVLTYHSFGPSLEHPYLSRMPVARFAEQLRYLTRHYEIVSLADGLVALQRDAEWSRHRPMAAITIDDGYSDNYEHVLPLVRSQAIPVTIFLATDYLDSGRLPWPTRISAILHYATIAELDAPLRLPLATVPQRLTAGRTLRHHLSRFGHGERDSMIADIERAVRPAAYAPLLPLSWHQVREMQRVGMRFGAHTHYHGWLDQLAPAEVTTELTLSRQRIEHETGQACTVLAYPNGNWSGSVAAVAARAGYAYALTQDRGINRKPSLTPMSLKRIEVPFNERLGSFACRTAGVAL